MRIMQMREGVNMANNIIREHRRLTILRSLYEQADFRLNESVLLDELHAYSFNLSADELRGELRWLEEQNLLAQGKIGNLVIAELTERGADVAMGRTTTHGVKRPRPRRG